MSTRSNHVIQSAAYLDPKLLSREPHLYKFKWYEYRNLPPFQCNLKFAQAYREAFRDYIRTNVDYRMEKKVTGISLRPWLFPHIPQSDREGIRQSVHLARQFADELGLPYYTYIWFCMTFAGNRRVKNIPRPNQLVPRMPERLTKGEEGRRETVERIWAAFGEHMLAFAEMRGETLEARARGQKLTEIGKNDPGCLGVAGSFSADTPDCRECPQQAKCSAISRVVQMKVQELDDSGAPTWRRVDHQRKGAAKAANAERQRRFRANQKAKVSHSSSPPPA